jgi:sulfur-carrier protein
MTTITATIKLFAVYQEAFDNTEVSRQLPANTPVSEVLELLIRERPNLARWREVTRFGINMDFVTPETIVRDRDEIVLIPPVSGG